MSRMDDLTQAFRDAIAFARQCDDLEKAAETKYYDARNVTQQANKQINDARYRLLRVAEGLEE